MKKLIIAILTCQFLFLPAQAETTYIQLTPRAEKVYKEGLYPLLNRVEPILKTMIKIRELPLKKPISVDILNKKELMKELTRQVNTSLKPEELEGERALYVRWKMLPPGFKYKDFLLNLYTEQIGGFYDAKTKKLYLIQGIPLSKLDMEALIAHELTHALQDQSYDLEKIMSSKKEKNDDKTLAIMAIVEGDAVVASEEYLRFKATKKSLSFFDVMGSFVNIFRMSASFKKLNESPGFIKNSLLFPYTTGREFISHFRQVEGWSWDDIGILYQTLPESTSQIYHPEKYLDGDKPLKLTLKPQPQTLLEGTLGEIGWNEFFKAHLSNRQARKITGGWDGDRFLVQKTPNNTYILRFKTAWNSTEEAQAFADNYQSVLLKRYPTAKEIKDKSTKNKKVYQLSITEQAWIKTQGNQVWLSEGESLSLSDN